MFHQRVNTISWSVLKNVPSVSEVELLDAATGAGFLLELEGFFLKKALISTRADASTRRGTKKRRKHVNALLSRTGAEETPFGKIGDTEWKQMMVTIGRGGLR